MYLNTRSTPSRRPSKTKLSWKNAARTVITLEHMLQRFSTSLAAVSQVSLRRASLNTASLALAVAGPQSGAGLVLSVEITNFENSRTPREQRESSVCADVR